jgi:hypothetical protein
MEKFAKAKEDNDMMNIKDVLSPGEQVLFDFDVKSNYRDSR